MANRRTQKSKIQKADENSGFDSQDFALSQESIPSPDARAEHQRILLKALTELRRKEKAEREKKTEKDKKFLQIIVKHLDRDLTKATDIIEETVKAAEAEYNAFLSKYTVQEDKIYNLWTEIQSEQSKLVDIVNEQHGIKKKAVTSTASAHLTALSNANSACNGTLTPFSVDVPVFDISLTSIPFLDIGCGSQNRERLLTA
ncbi:hypothetical protein BYT27DRAFT_7336142 [Phlegmacium glaucopus]|nr:hypothetical protein BYT27DRAFT_7336142 [Phlegmacium glaucopus]